MACDISDVKLDDLTQSTRTTRKLALKGKKTLLAKNQDKKISGGSNIVKRLKNETKRQER